MLGDPRIWSATAALLLAAPTASDDRSPRPERGDDSPGVALRAPTTAAPSPRSVAAPASFGLTVDGDADLGGFLFQGVMPFMHNDGAATYRNSAVGLNALISLTPAPGMYDFSYGADNTAVGYQALTNATSGYRNTATGVKALYSNTEGGDNTAIGFWALTQNTVGSDNTAVGFQSAYANTGGTDNTSVGFQSLRTNTIGSKNTAVGQSAMRQNNSGNFNTGLGYRALRNSNGSFNTAVGSGSGHDLTGSKHTAVGWNAGQHWTYGSYNIGLGVGADGIAGEYATIRIGGNNYQTKTFIEGVNNTEVAGTPVCIAADDELGLCPALGLLQGGFNQVSPQLWEQLRQQDAELAELRKIVADLRRTVADLRRREGLRGD